MNFPPEILRHIAIFTNVKTLSTLLKIPLFKCLITPSFIQDWNRKEINSQELQELTLEEIYLLITLKSQVNIHELFKYVLLHDNINLFKSFINVYSDHLLNDYNQEQFNMEYNHQLNFWAKILNRELSSEELQREKNYAKQKVYEKLLVSAAIKYLSLNILRYLEKESYYVSTECLSYIDTCVPIEKAIAMYNYLNINNHYQIESMLFRLSKSNRLIPLFSQHVISSFNKKNFNKIKM